MSLSIGIVGLPNVGKSCLFNAITNNDIPSENFPFCTIDPNNGIVEVPDPRLEQLSKISGSEKTLHATIEFVDIAGLVKGAADGEGLGNKFLSHIRETTAIAHMVRCFEDDNITHVEGRISPLDDIEIINLELIYADLEMANKLVENQSRRIKSNDKSEVQKYELYKKLQACLAESKPVRQLTFTENESNLLKGLNFLSSKKVIYVANVSENDMNGNAHSKAVENYAKENNDSFVIISAQIESELAQLDTEEQDAFLSDLGLNESGLNRLAKSGFELLNLQTYLTSGKKETRAWTIKKGSSAPQAAGVIHTDFEKGFIRANITSYEDFIEYGGFSGAKEKGKLRQEGQDYIMQDGDVVEFLFNV